MDKKKVVENILEYQNEFENNEKKDEEIMKKNFISNTLAIGVGQAGGNVISKLYAEDIRTIAINTSRYDLEKISSHQKIQIENVNGTGKDRRKAIEIIINNHQDILSDVYKTIDEDKDIKTLVIVGSGGGGTASGMLAPIVKILKTRYPSMFIYAVGILGGIEEDLRTQKNLMEFVEDIEKNSLCPYILMDNGLSNAETLKGVYNEINTSIVNIIKYLDGYLYKSSTISNIDSRDKAKLFIAGRMVVTGIEEVKTNLIGNNNLDKVIIDSVKNNLQIPVGSYVESYGFYLKTNDLNKFDTNFLELQKEFGESITIFKHIEDQAGIPEILIVMTGLDSPIERYQLIEQRIREFEMKERRGLPSKSVDTSFITNIPTFLEEEPVDEKTFQKKLNINLFDDFERQD